MSDESVPKIERVRITVTASGAHPDVFSVQDAMRQVSDFFDLLTPEGSETFVWNLKMASASSPLTVEGEPYSPEPEVNAQALAYHQKINVEESFRSLSEGRPPQRRLTPKRRSAIRRIFSRNMQSIGKTEAFLSKIEPPVFITPSTALISVKTLDQADDADFQALLMKDRSRNEEGVIEGTLLEVGSDYNRPSVLIVERNTDQEVTCRVNAETYDKISSQTSFRDVWERARVRVRGRITYNADGTIRRVWAHDLTPVKPRKVELNEIADPDFTSGRAIHDYLERLREGSFGEGGS